MVVEGVQATSSPRSQSYFSKSFLKPLRRLVSGTRARHSESGFDLDMSYITANILAMAFPASGMEASFRNPRQQVRTYLNQYHEERYLVFNLCAEKRCQYDPLSFAHRMASEGAVCFPIKEHSVPTLYQVADFCQQALAWLGQNPENLVAVHCLGGKGRTGLMIACLLIAARTCHNAPEAIELFNSMRSRHGEECLKIPSQIRCVKLFEELLSLSNYSVPLSITSLSVSSYQWALLGFHIGGLERGIVRSIRVRPRSAELEKKLELPALLQTNHKGNFNLEGQFTCTEDCHFTIKLKRTGHLASGLTLKFWIFSQISQTMINHRCTSDGTSTVFFNAQDLDSPLNAANKLEDPKSEDRFFVKVSLKFTKLT